MARNVVILCTLLVMLAACGGPAQAPALPGGSSSTPQAGTATPDGTAAAISTQSAQVQPSATIPAATPTNIVPSATGTSTTAATPTNTQPPPTATNTATRTPTSTRTNTPVPTNTPTATPTTPPAPQSINHSVSLIAAREIYHIRLVTAGLIKVHAVWTGSQSSLALIINGPGQVSYFARQDGASGLDVSYTVTAANFAAGTDWTVSVASFGSGQASGTVTITYPSGSSHSPFQNDFNVSPSYGSDVHVLVLKHAGPILAQATWTGAPASLALIINGPGQVGYFARQDGGSGLTVGYSVSPANFAAGDTWRVSLTAFTAPSANGTFNATFP